MLGAIALTMIILGTGALVLGKLGSRFIDWIDTREAWKMEHLTIAGETVKAQFIVVLAISENKHNTETITKVRGSISGQGLKDGYVEHFKTLLKMNPKVTPNQMKEFFEVALNDALEEIEEATK